MSSMTGVTIINPQAQPSPPRAQDATPVDPDRPAFVGKAPTHIVLANGLGPDYVRGDMISAADLPKGSSIDRLLSLTPAPLRALLPGEGPAKPSK